MLLAVADLKPHWEFVGQDVDLRYVRMTTINLALRNLYGYVVWGNSLGLEKRVAIAPASIFVDLSARSRWRTALPPFSSPSAMTPYRRTQIQTP